jgi:hypothetical protein
MKPMNEVQRFLLYALLLLALFGCGVALGVVLQGGSGVVP